MRIAVIDEEEALRCMVQAALEWDGHTVTCFARPPSHLIGFDLVVIEPGEHMRWIETVIRLKAQCIRIIILTFHDENMLAGEVLSLSAFKKLNYKKSGLAFLMEEISSLQAVVENRR
ncbi:MAG: hypothetical protein JOZ18_16910 [Chloroflexi bacterium]|nr:hypothetical protein [Chloroflexota bacterium]